MMFEIIKETPIYSWLSAISIIISTLLVILYRLHPELLERKRKTSIEVFERLCEAYATYDPTANVSRARLEFAAEEYCRTHIDHRLVDMAFKSESATQVLNDLRRLPNAISYKDGAFRTRLPPHTFPTKEKANRTGKIALSLYLITSTMLVGSFMSVATGFISVQIAVLILALSTVPAWACFEFIMKSRKQQRLSRIGEIVMNKD